LIALQIPFLGRFNMKKNPDWKLKKIYISQIDYVSNTFNWFPGDLPECYRKSIKEDGIRLPLLVQSVKDSKFELVDGFKRLSWLRSVQKSSFDEYHLNLLPCLIIPTTFSIRDVAKIRVETLSVDINSLSGIYLCKVLKMLSEAGFSKNEIAFDLFPILGLVSSVRLVGQLLNLQKKMVIFELNAKSILPESIMSMGYEDLLPLLKFSSSDFCSVIRLAKKMDIKGKKWRNLLQVLDELIRLRETTAEEIFKFPEIKKILENSNINGPVRYRLLKQLFDSLRYPELSKMSKRFDHRSKNLKLTDRITLERDPYFEKDELALVMKFQSVNELRDHLMNLTEKVNSENLLNTWNDLFAVLHEE